MNYGFKRPVDVTRGGRAADIVGESAAEVVDGLAVGAVDERAGEFTVGQIAG